MSPDGPGRQEEDCGLGGSRHRTVTAISDQTAAEQMTGASLHSRRVDRDVHVHDLLDGRTLTRAMHT